MKPIPAPAPDAFGTRVIEGTDRLIRFGLPFLYFLIAVAFYLKTYDSAQIKITLVQLGGLILVATWLVKILEQGGSRTIARHWPVVAPLLAFWVSGAVSLCFSPFKEASLNEFIRRSFYMAVPIILIAEFNSQDKLRRLFNWLIAGTYVVCLYGVVQFLDYRFFPPAPEPGLDPFIWRCAFGERIFSSFGNPNFFGDYLVVMGPIALALFLRKRQLHYLLLWALTAFCVTFTYSKGAWLGYASGLVIFVFLVVGFFTHARGSRVKRWLLWMMAVTIIVAGLGMRHQLKGRPDSSSFRVFTWVSCWEMIRTNPIIGTGIGTFYVTYPAWRRPQIFYIEGRHNTETDHPENEYLEIWFDEGLIGFGVFLLLIGGFLTMGFRNLAFFCRRNESGQPDIRAYYQLGVLTAVMAQLIHNFVCVSLRFVSSGVMLWLLIGIIGTLNINNPMPEQAPALSPPGGPLRIIRRALQALVVASACWIGFVFVGYFDADVKQNLGIFFSKQSQWTAALDNYTGVVRQNPSYIMAYYFIGNVYNDRWIEGDADRAIAAYRHVWALAPNYVQSHHQAGLIYLKHGEDENRRAQEARSKGDLKAAARHQKNFEDAWNDAERQFKLYQVIDPVYSLNYYRLAWIYMQRGQPDKAEAVYKSYLETPLKLLKAPHNIWVEDWGSRRLPEISETCVNIGNIRFMKNDFPGALKYFEQAVTYNPQSLPGLKNVAITLMRMGRMQAGIKAWERVRSVAPDDPDVKRVFPAPA